MVVTVNQVVAWNLAWYRHAAGLTQADLGHAIGWKKSAVSDAERSVSGKWTREFDAHTITVIAGTLGIPISALFLPPDDDGITVRYRVEVPGDDGFPILLDMRDLLALTLPDYGSDTAAMGAYKDRLRAATARYFDEFWKAEVDRWLDEAGSEELRADFIARLRSRSNRLRAQVAEDDDLVGFLEQTKGRHRR